MYQRHSILQAASEGELLYCQHLWDIRLASRNTLTETDSGVPFRFWIGKKENRRFLNDSVTVLCNDMRQMPENLSQKNGILGNIISGAVWKLHNQHDVQPEKMQKCSTGVDLTISVYHVVGQRFLQYRRHRPHFFTPELQFGPHFNKETCLSAQSDKSGSNRTSPRTWLTHMSSWQRPWEPAILCQGNKCTLHASQFFGTALPLLLILHPSSFL